MSWPWKSFDGLMDPTWKARICGVSPALLAPSICSGAMPHTCGMSRRWQRSNLARGVGCAAARLRSPKMLYCLRDLFGVESPPRRVCAPKRSTRLS